MDARADRAHAVARHGFLGRIEIAEEAVFQRVFLVQFEQFRIARQQRHASRGEDIVDLGAAHMHVVGGIEDAGIGEGLVHLVNRDGLVAGRLAAEIFAAGLQRQLAPAEIETALEIGARAVDFLDRECAADGQFALGHQRQVGAVLTADLADYDIAAGDVVELVFELQPGAVRLHEEIELVVGGEILFAARVEQIVGEQALRHLVTTAEIHRIEFGGAVLVGADPAARALRAVIAGRAPARSGGQFGVGLATAERVLEARVDVDIGFEHVVGTVRMAVEAAQVERIEFVGAVVEVDIGGVDLGNLPVDFPVRGFHEPHRIVILI